MWEKYCIYYGSHEGQKTRRFRTRNISAVTLNCRQVLSSHKVCLTISGFWNAVVFSDMLSCFDYQGRHHFQRSVPKITNVHSATINTVTTSLSKHTLEPRFNTSQVTPQLSYQHLSVTKLIKIKPFLYAVSHNEDISCDVHAVKNECNQIHQQLPQE